MFLTPKRKLILRVNPKVHQKKKKKDLVLLFISIPEHNKHISVECLAGQHTIYYFILF